jgi:hypothetical protein
MKDELVLIGPDLPYLVELSILLRGLNRNLTIQDSAKPLAAALLRPFGEPQAAIVCLTGIENVADVRALLTSHPQTRFLFLSKAAPPRAPLAHAIHECGGQILPVSEPAIVVAATLISMIARRSEAAEQAR